MTRVHIICEGQTEETFVNELLRNELVAKGVLVTPSLLGKPGRKGGDVRIERVVADVRHRLLSDPTSHCTTFIDYYGIDPDFPGKAEARSKATIQEKAECLQAALAAHVENAVGENAARRFIPYVQMHEFEGLLFSDPQKMAEGICQAHMESTFSAIRSGFPSPEDINDSPGTAPSKRILVCMPGYEKVISGTLAALEIGLQGIRDECRLFDGWLKRIEALGG